MKSRGWLALLVVGLVAVAVALGVTATRLEEPAPSECSHDVADLKLEVVAEIPHDPKAFSQGLTIHEGSLYESTGRRGESSVRLLDMDTGEILRQRDLPAEFFGEGLTGTRSGELVQLTWTSGTAFRWNPDTFEELGRNSYIGEGWGLATDAVGMLVMSDGSDELQIRESDDFSLRQSVEVVSAEGKADGLNELDFDGTRVWANRWKTDEIVRINMDCGDVAVVDGVLDAAELTERASELANDAQPIDVLNGIASLGEDRFLLTGKLWPVMFEVKIIDG